MRCAVKAAYLGFARKANYLRGRAIIIRCVVTGVEKPSFCEDLGVDYFSEHVLDACKLSSIVKVILIDLRT